MLKVKKFREDAIIPTVGHAGEDLAFDLYALDDAVLVNGIAQKIRTGVGALFEVEGSEKSSYGLLIRDRSSMAANSVIVSGGVVDAGYRGEIIVLLTNTAPITNGAFSSVYKVKKGDKIAQMIPIPVLTGQGVIEVEELPEANRGDAGFGSTGK